MFTDTHKLMRISSWQPALIDLEGQAECELARSDIIHIDLKFQSEQAIEKAQNKDYLRTLNFCHLNQISGFH